MVKFKWYVEPYNFGDILTPYVLDHFGIQHSYVDNIEDAEAVCIGSIARLALPGQTVYGSGRIRINEKAEPRAIWKCVRGPITRQNVLDHGGECPAIYGDPALLLPDFCKPREKTHKLGIVPHYQDYHKVYGLLSDTWPDAKIINVVNTNPLEVAQQITQCESIISSSLHGIIAAQAYDIPVAWVQWTKLHGDGTKFNDYFQSVDVEGVQSSITLPYFLENKTIDLEPLRQVLRDATI